MEDIRVVLIIYNIRGVISAKGNKMLKGNCIKCKRNKSVTVSGAIIEAEGLKDFFERFGRATVNFGKKVANNPVRALEIASKIGSAPLTRKIIMDYLIILTINKS